jgi:hypothetical protein
MSMNAARTARIAPAPSLSPTAVDKNGAPWTAPVEWAGARRFAFTIFDDPDGQTLATSRLVYHFLRDIGLRTTIAVWTLPPVRERNSSGETCGNPEYLKHVLALQECGFEIAWHNAAPHTCTREETLEAFERFRLHFGHDPFSAANHYNGEALYWGPERVEGMRRTAYLAMTRFQSKGKHFGGVDGHPVFWGDLCRQRIQYFRNFVFSDLNTLKRCPWMPYVDPRRKWVRNWFAGSEGAEASSFIKAISEKNQDRLEEEGGCAVLYTHFGRGFVENGRLKPEFVRLMTRLAKKGGWYAPTRSILDHLTEHRGVCVLPDGVRDRLEWRWLGEKMFRGTS